MSGQHPPTAVAALDVANLREDQWCRTCKAYTGFTADVVTIHERGVTIVATIIGCVVCDDPDDPEAHRG